MDILIIKLGSIGDIVHLIPAYNLIRENFKDANFYWVCDTRNVEILDFLYDIKHVFTFDRSLRNPLKIFYELKKLKAGLKNYKFDISIDFQGMFISGLISYMADARERIGNPEMREFSGLFSKKTGTYYRNQHAVDRYIEVSKYLGCKGDVSFNMKLEEKLILETKDRFGIKSPSIGIAPVSRVEKKIWDLNRFFDLINMLLEDGLNVYILGKGKNFRTPDNAVNLINKTTLKEAIYIIKNLDFFIGVDSALLHIAVALGKMVIGLYGSASTIKTAPYYGAMIDNMENKTAYSVYGVIKKCFQL